MRSFPCDNFNMLIFKAGNTKYKQICFKTNMLLLNIKQFDSSFFLLFFSKSNEFVLFTMHAWLFQIV